jgi:hypothetical protein
MVYNVDELTLGFRSEGVFADSASSPIAYYINQTEETFGTVTTSVTGTTNAVFTNTASNWAVDRLIGAKAKAWTNSTKASYLGEGTIDDNTTTTFTVTTADYSTTPIGEDPYYEIDPFAMAGIQAAYTNDLGMVFNAGIALPNPELEWIEDRNIGTKRAVSVLSQGKYVAKGTLSGRLRVPRLLFFALGKESVAESSGTYTHTITEHSNIPSFCMEAAATTGSDFIRYYRGCKVNSIKLSGAMGEPLMMEAELFCAIPEKTSNTVSTVTLDSNTGNYKSGDPYLWSGMAGLTYLSNSYADILEMELNINNNLRDDEYFFNSTNSKYANSFSEGGLDIDLRCKVRITDPTLWNELMSPTTGAPTAAQKATFTFTRTASYDTLAVTLHSCQLYSVSDDVPEEGPVEVEVLLKPRYDGTNEAITITVVDNKATYNV